jgi:hypothetical protein
VRFDEWSDGESRDQAVTVAGFWTPTPKITVGVEFSAGAGEQRSLGDLRYRFARPIPGW